MSFIKINSREETKTLKREDPEFEKAYSAIEAEYNLIQKATKIRKAHNISQEDIAEKTGFTQQSVSRIEKVSHTPTLRSFIKYLEGMDLELDIKEKEKV